MSHGSKMVPLKYFFSAYDLKTCSPQQATNRQKKCLYLNTCMVQPCKIKLCPSSKTSISLYRNKSKAILDCFSFSSPNLIFLIFNYGLKHWRRKFNISWSRALSLKRVKQKGSEEGSGKPQWAQIIFCSLWVLWGKSEDGAQAHYGVLSLFTLEYPQFTDSTKQYRIVYNVISQECNVPPSPTLSFKLVWWTQFSSKDNMIFGQSGGIRNMILFMLDTCVIFLNIQSWVYAGLQQSFYYSWKMTACRVIMFRLVIMQFTIAYVEGNMKF